MCKVFIIAAFVAVASALTLKQNGHAISSQSIVLHGEHGYETQQGPLQQTFGINSLQNQHYVAPHYQHHDDHHIDYYAHPHYGFEYKVQDPHTGDNKYQHEIRDGDVVKGVYSLHESDGTIRIVEYSADKHHGFNAVVKHEGHAQHIQPDQYHGHH